MTWDPLFLIAAAARWLGYLAAFVIVGATAMRRLVLPRTGFIDPTPVPLARWAQLGTVLLAVSLVARLYFQGRSLLEPDEPLTAEFVGLVLQSAWGRGWLAQAAAGFVAVVGWSWVRRKPSAPGAARLSIVAAAAIIATAPLTGHAVGLAGAPWYSPLLDLVHFGAGAAWIGTLASLTIVLRTGQPQPLALVEAFSPLALVAGITAMAAGAVLAYGYLGGIGPLFETGYGRMVLAKLAAIGVTSGLGVYNWRSVLPRLRAGAPAPIVRTATLEALVGVVVLAITAVLVSLPAPGEPAE